MYYPGGWAIGLLAATVPKTFLLDYNHKMKALGKYFILID
jgi:hypothetical protein